MIQLKCYSETEKESQKIFEDITNDITKLFTEQCKELTNDYKQSLNIDLLVDIKCYIEKAVLKQYVLTGRLLEFGIHSFVFNKQLSYVILNISAFMPTWYSGEDEPDSLDSDDLFFSNGLKVELPKELTVDKDSFALDLSECEKHRDKDCNYYAKSEGFKRSKSNNKKAYNIGFGYLATISR